MEDRKEIKSSKIRATFLHPRKLTSGRSWWPNGIFWPFPWTPWAGCGAAAGPASWLRPNSFSHYFGGCHGPVVATHAVVAAVAVAPGVAVVVHSTSFRSCSPFVRQF